MVGGLLVAIAGLMFLLHGLNVVVSSSLAHTVAGACILLNGLSILVHKMGMCPMCASKDGKDGKCC